MKMKKISFEEYVHRVVEHAFKVTRSKGFVFKPMNRTKPVAKGRGYVEGHTSLSSKTIVIDIYTARLRKPKKISAILAVLAHEIAHHQKPPYRQLYRGRWITRMHYPKFYKQVNKNITKFKKDRVLGKYYE